MFSLFRAKAPRRFLLEKMPRSARCAEIGVWQGDFSDEILRATSPLELHLIDPWTFQAEFPRRWYGGSKAVGQSSMDMVHDTVRKRFAGNAAVRIHRKSSLEAAADFPQDFFDWLYIDGDHSYEAVVADLEAWTPKVKRGGFVTGDDYYWRDESSKRSVKRAVDEFRARHDIREFLVKNEQFIIRLPS